MFHYFKKQHGWKGRALSRRRRKSSVLSNRYNSRLKIESLEPRWVLDSAILQISGSIDSNPVVFTDSNYSTANILTTPTISTTTANITSQQSSISGFTSGPLLRQMEYLDRGVVAVRSSTSQAYIGWRLLGLDPSNIAFNLYRSANGGAAVKLNGSPLTQTTDFVDGTANLTQTNAYYVRPVIGGVEQAPSESFTLAANAPVQQYLSIPLNSRPAAPRPTASTTPYSAPTIAAWAIWTATASTKS